MRALPGLAALLLLAASARGLAAEPAGAGAAAPIGVVAAENVYGDLARQIGGPAASVTSVLSNPGQDPHLFEPSPSTARAVSAARIVVRNGAGYDPWMDALLAASRGADRTVLVVADLAERTAAGGGAGANPHLWYDLRTMLSLAEALAGAFASADPAHRADYEERLGAFRRSMEPVQAQAAALRERLAGAPATATEPVFGRMFDALGMQVRNQGFQLSVMNGAEPSASEVAAFEDDLKGRKVRLLVYNSQASDPLAERMRTLARASGIPVVGATETEPPGETYQAWMGAALDAVDRALPGPQR